MLSKPPPFDTATIGRILKYPLDEYSILTDNGIMKTTIDIPEQALKDAMRFAGTKTKRTAIVMAVEEFNTHHRMAALTRHLGTCKDLMSTGELKRLRAER
jgi:Arc/MetJ family transcription regulator